ncbi:MAG: class I SAM-dependent methyltransferase [Planctomycetota bacterium]|jgi:ubiquinone/menaquinone biosynthesis C-methylase UbiE
MGVSGEPLYGSGAARALSRREKAREEGEREKHALLLERLPRRGRLLDIGCGPGRFLRLASRIAGECLGLDESLDRLSPARGTTQAARMVLARADGICFRGGSFDVVTASQVLHEVRLFGREGEFTRVLGEVNRVLGPRGIFLLLDHLDGGDGHVRVRLPTATLERLELFEKRYRFRLALHEKEAGGVVRLSRRDLQDFLTKDWSLGTAMEAIEMQETHNVFQEGETVAALQEAGFHQVEWLPFSSIDDDLDRCRGERVSGESWHRKFLLSARRG